MLGLRERMEENGTAAPPSMEGKRSAAAPPDPEVVDKPTRRRFAPSYKQRIVEEADRCTEPGEVGRLLRREGLYSSHLIIDVQGKVAGLLGLSLEDGTNS